MQYLIKIEDNKDLRVVVNYNPFDNELLFNGQIKTKKLVWVTANNFTFNVKDIDDDFTTERFNELVLNLVKDLKNKYKIMERVDELFSDFKKVEVVSDDDKINVNEAYGFDDKLTNI